MKADPQTQALNVMIEEASSQGKPWHEMEPQELRDILAEGGPFGPPPPKLDDIAQERTIPGPAGDIPVRVFIPPVVRGVYLHIHGGGWVIGSHDGADERLWERAQATQQAVVSVGYRLSPEYPYPAPNEDCEAAAVWLVENGQSEFGTDAFTIGGESAGGHLSATTLLRMRDNHGYTGFKGAALNYGVYDLRHSPSARLWGPRNLILSSPIMEWFIDHYVTPEEPELRDLPGCDAAARRPLGHAAGHLHGGNARSAAGRLAVYGRSLAGRGSRDGAARLPGGAARFRRLPNTGGDGCDESGE